MKKIIISFAVLVSCVLSGCNDFLDKLPDNRTKVDNPEKIQALLVKAYPMATYASIIDARCDGFIDKGATMSGAQPGASAAFVKGAFMWDEYSPTDGNDTNERYWTSCYEAIAASNQALKSIAKMKDKSKLSVLKAEALLTRAYAHFCLISLYANMFDYGKEAVNPGIPFVDEVEDVVIKPYARGTVAEILAKIKADLDEGIKSVGGKSDYAQPAFHFTLNSAKAFAVRYALFTKDYPAVISIANSMMPTPTTFLSLTDAENNPILNQDGTPVHAVNPSDPAYLFFTANLHNWSAYKSLSGGSSGIGQAASSPKKAANLLLSEVVSSHNRTCRGIAYSRYSLSAATATALLGVNATGGSWDFPSYSFSGDDISWYPKFYEDFKVTNGSGGVVSGITYMKFPLFKMEEVLLARAEAYALTGKYDMAIHDLNMYVQKRIQSFNLGSHLLYKDKIVEYYSQLTKDKDHYINNKWNASRFTVDMAQYEGEVQRALMMTILDFRRTEFMYEGLRYFDILRWFIPVTHKTIDGKESTLTPDDDRRVLQIPVTADLSGVEPNKLNNIPMPWK